MQCSRMCFREVYYHTYSVWSFRKNTKRSWRLECYSLEQTEKSSAVNAVCPIANCRILVTECYVIIYRNTFQADSVQTFISPIIRVVGCGVFLFEECSKNVDSLFL